MQEIHFNIKHMHYLKVKVREKIFWANGPKNQAGIAILVSNKIDLKQKLNKRDEEGLSIVKLKVYQDNIS